MSRQLYYDDAKNHVEHALGLGRGRWSYRNYFAAAPGTQDYDDWIELTRRGFAQLYLKSSLLHYFFATKAGIEYYELQAKVRRKDIYG